MAILISYQSVKLMRIKLILVAKIMFFVEHQNVLLLILPVGRLLFRQLADSRPACSLVIGVGGQQ